MWPARAQHVREGPLIFRGGPITAVTRLDHAGITVPCWKRPQVSVRGTPGIVVVPIRLDYVATAALFLGCKFAPHAALCRNSRSRAMKDFVVASRSRKSARLARSAKRRCTSSRASTSLLFLNARCAIAAIPAASLGTSDTCTGRPLSTSLTHVHQTGRTVSPTGHSESAQSRTSSRPARSPAIVGWTWTSGMMPMR